jgi:lipopolysaccharide transport system ATP-binding protein
MQYAIVANAIGKKFNRSLGSGLWLGLQDGLRRLTGLKPRSKLHRNEFWALSDISFSVPRGTCTAIIGPNGAGKSTLLNIIARTVRADQGQIVTAGAITLLNRAASDLQPMLSGRENIYIYCTSQGIKSQEVPPLLDEIVAFAGLAARIDAPLKTYSDGMFARLQFAMATAMCPDILLIDEVLAVGDLEFQIRCLERINQMKRKGTAVVFVSHSEMNVRHVADHGLLLFDGHQMGHGDLDALFHQYYLAVGIHNEKLRPLGDSGGMPADIDGPIGIRSAVLKPGSEGGVEIQLETASDNDWSGLEVSLHLRTPASLRIGTVMAAGTGKSIDVPRGTQLLRVSFSTDQLAPGLYRISAELALSGQVLAYKSDVGQFHVASRTNRPVIGFISLPADIRLEPGGR